LLCRIFQSAGISGRCINNECYAGSCTNIQHKYFLSRLWRYCGHRHASRTWRLGGGAFIWVGNILLLHLSFIALMQIELRRRPVLGRSSEVYLHTELAGVGSSGYFPYCLELFLLC
jgi:hypothetical protein